MRCKKIMSFKYASLMANKPLLVCTLMIILYFNFCAIFNSGVLASGGAEFNELMKYELLVNNYHSIEVFYGLFLAVFIGAGMIGPDLVSGNIYVVLSAYDSRKKYFLFNCLTGWLYYLLVHILMTLNFLAMLFIFQIQIPWGEVAYIALTQLLNATVIFSVTCLGSVFLKGYKSIAVGLCAYCFYHIYTYNTIPFVNSIINFPIAVHINELYYLMPIQYAPAASVTSPETMAEYHISSFFGQPMLYQCLYAIAIFWLASILFEKRDL